MYSSLVQLTHSGLLDFIRGKLYLAIKCDTCQIMSRDHTSAFNNDRGNEICMQFPAAYLRETKQGWATGNTIVLF